MQTSETYEQRRDREQRETAERNKTDRQAIANVCEILGFKRIEQREENPHSVRAEYENEAGEILYFSAGGYGEKDRIFVSGSLPRYEHGGSVDSYYTRDMESDRISVSRSRAACSPATIAKDIERRCLPAYRVKRAKVLEVIAADTKYRDNTEKTFQALTGKKPAKDYNQPNMRPTEVNEHYSHPEEGISRYVSATVRGTSVSLKVEGITAEQAKEIIRLLGVKP